MKLTHEQKMDMITKTQSVAIALLEDLEHLREMAGGWHHTSAELRRASSILRRLLIDGDLHKVGAPRIGKMLLKIPDYTKFYRAAENAGEFALFASFDQIQIASPKNMTRKMSLALHTTPGDRGMKYTQVKIDTFKTQKVFCFDGKWVSRADVIKFVANNASGVHSSEPSDHILPSIRRAFTYNREENGDFRLFMNPPGTAPSATKPFEYDPKKIDPVLAEILGSSRLIVESTDVVRLEDVVRQEIGISPQPTRARA
jgi:hypothetical protein